MKGIYFKSHVLFYSWLIEKGVNVDIMASLKGYRFSIVVDGEKLYNRNLPSLLEDINSKFKLKINSKDSSIKGKNGYFIVVEEDDCPISINDFEELQDVIEDSDEETLSIDYDLIESFLNGSDKKSEAKSKLEKYALNTFNIELDKRSTFENMVSSLEEQLK